MYSDEPLQLKQPRLIIPPGEGQDIFTTSGLQKAAKVYESGEELEGRMATDRSRRLLESAGMFILVCMPIHETVYSKTSWQVSRRHI